MARGINKVILVGNLGRDPEVRYMPSGGQVTNVTIATSEIWRDKNTGENQERTEWHRVVFFGRLAEIAGEYLRKGSQVYIEGKLQTRKWQDQNGQDRYTTEIIANEMQMLGSRAGSGIGDQSGYSGGYDDNYEQTTPARQAVPSSRTASQRNQPQNQTPTHSDYETAFGDDDIPF